MSGSVTPCGFVVEPGRFDGMGGTVPDRVCGRPSVAVWAREWRHDEVPMCRVHDRRAMAVQRRRDPRTAGWNRTELVATA